MKTVTAFRTRGIVRVSLLAILVAGSIWITLGRARADTGVAAQLDPQVSTGAGKVVALAASGSTVAFALDQGEGEAEECGALRVWSTATGRQSTVKTLDCGEEIGFTHIAVARETVVWSELTQTNHLWLQVFSASASRPVVGRGRELFGKSVGLEAYIGAMAADDDVVAFTTQEGAYVGGADARLWVGNERSVHTARRVTSWMDRVAVEGSEVVLGYRNGRVEIFGSDGKRVTSLPVGIAPNGIAFDARNLIALGEQAVSIRDPSSGAVRASRPLARPGQTVQLEDAQREYVVYRSRRELRLLRLSDGRDVKLPTAAADPRFVHARFCDDGLVVAYPHVVKLLSHDTLQRLLDSRR